MADLVQAVGPFVARLSGARVLVRAGDLYSADDALVGAFPGKFREPKVLSSPAPVPTRPAPEPELNQTAIDEFAELKITDEADVALVAESVSKLDDATKVALLAEYEIEEDTPEAALTALAATRLHAPPKPTRAELLAKAKERGIDVSPRAKWAEIAAALDAG